MHYVMLEVDKMQHFMFEVNKLQQLMFEVDRNKTFYVRFFDGGGIGHGGAGTNAKPKTRKNKHRPANNRLPSLDSLDY